VCACVCVCVCVCVCCSMEAEQHGRAALVAPVTTLVAPATIGDLHLQRLYDLPFQILYDNLVDQPRVRMCVGVHVCLYA